MGRVISTAVALLVCGALGSSVAEATTVTLGGVNPGDPPGDCGSTTWVPQALASGAPSYTVPADFGVITSWSTKVGFFASTFKLKVLRPTASSSSFLVVEESDAKALPSSSPSAVFTYPMRIPVQPGDLIGMKSSALSGCGIASTGSTIQQTGADSDPPKGGTATLAGVPASDRRLNISVSVESDGDGDGFGDDTQDLCPVNGATQGTCPTVPRDTQAPVISELVILRRKFRAYRSGRSAKRRASKAKKGTAFVYRLSEAATVTFSIERRSSGRKVAGRCRKKTRGNTRRRRCSRYRAAGSFSQAGQTGANRKSFSGRLGTRSLGPASYRATLVAKDAAGNSSKPRRVAFRVVRR